MKKKRERKIPTSFRLSETAHDLLQQLVEVTGIERGAVLELAIRELASRRTAKLRGALLSPDAPPPPKPKQGVRR
jgi:hypothetical protein